MVEWVELSKIAHLGGQTFQLGSLGAFIRQRCLGIDSNWTAFSPISTAPISHLLSGWPKPLVPLVPIQAEEADQSQRQRWCDADAFLCQVWEALTVWPYV